MNEYIDNKVKELVKELDFKYGFDGEQLPEEVENKLKKVLLDNLKEFKELSQ